MGATLTNGKYAAQHGLTTTTITPGHRCAHRNRGGASAVCLMTPPCRRPGRKAVLLRDGRCDVTNRRRDRRYRPLLFHPHRQATFPMNDASSGSHVIHQGQRAPPRSKDLLQDPRRRAFPAVFVRRLSAVWTADLKLATHIHRACSGFQNQPTAAGRLAR